MHILTKIFIVLVALLTVALVPLVMVNAANERTFKSRWEQDQTRLSEAIHDRDASKLVFDREKELAGAEIAKLKVTVDALEKEKATTEASLHAKDAELATLRARQDDFNASTKAFTENDKAKLMILQQQTDELVGLRSRLTKAEEEYVKLDEELTITRLQLEVADTARRALQEERQRLSEEKEQAMGDVKRYEQWVGKLPSASGAVRTGAVADTVRVPADRAVTATVINVKREKDSTLAEINAGSRDGVQVGWVMTIADKGQFIGNLRITNVDVNRSTGIVELEDPHGRGEVKSGQKAMIRKGD